jgi:hypothetical protein
MGKPLGDDLRRKLLYAYDQGEGTLEELGRSFSGERWLWPARGFVPVELLV